MGMRGKYSPIYFFLILPDFISFRFGPSTTMTSKLLQHLPGYKLLLYLRSTYAHTKIYLIYYLNALRSSFKKYTYLLIKAMATCNGI